MNVSSSIGYCFKLSNVTYYPLPTSISFSCRTALVLNY